MPKTKELNELGDWKVGQEVCIEKGGLGGFRRICKIERITNGRKGTVYANDRNFDIHGNERGTGYHQANMTPATDKDRMDIKGANARRRLKNVEWNKLGPLTAIKIENLLNENGIKTKT